MSRALVCLAVVLVVLALAACKAIPAPPPEPKLVPVEVKVPVASNCIPDTIKAPTLDPDKVIAEVKAAKSGSAAVTMIGTTWLQALARLKILEPAIAECRKLPAP